MSQLDLSALIKVHRLLSEAIDDSRNAAFIGLLTDSQKRLVMAGVIQNFEFCYELTYKMLKRRLELDAASPLEVDQSSFRELIRTAAEKGLITDPELWFEFRRQRNITSHTYEQSKAESVYASAIRFQQEAGFVLQELTRRND